MKNEDKIREIIKEEVREAVHLARQPLSWTESAAEDYLVKKGLRPVRPQNDIADAINWIINLLGLDPTTGLGKFLRGIADFFDNLTSSQRAQMAQLGGVNCFVELRKNVTADIMIAALQVAQAFPSRLTELVDCIFNDPGGESSVKAQAVKAQLFGIDPCLWAAAKEFFASRDVWKAVLAYMACKAGGAPKPPDPPDPPSPPAPGFNPSTSPRC